MQITFKTGKPWTATKDRLPEPGRVVLVYSEWDDAYSIGFLQPGEDRLWSIQEDFFNFLLVDYWRELDISEMPVTH